MLPPTSEVYYISLDDSFLEGFWSLNKELRYNVKDVEKLRRFKHTCPKGFERLGTFATPLHIHYLALCKCGQVPVARTFLGYLHLILNKMQRKSIPQCYTDDFVRQHLKYLSGWCFPRVFSESPGFMLLMHLHALGAKSPYSKTEIEDDIKTWVSDNKEFPYPEFVKEKINSIFNRWNYNTDNSLFLPFREYCNDPLRWGTSGGAKASRFRGEKFRTKWAWAFSKLTTDNGEHLRDNVDLYSEALKESDTAKVALKEEPTKTRPVITTPMDSYMRQSFLLYRWGKPPLDSPISSSSWLPTFQATSYRWYGCLDGDRFDQTIPKWVILYIIDKLGELSEECRMVADAEIEHLNNLNVEWNGKTWRWEGGILSGWRVTSLIGSIISDVVADWIIEKSGKSGTIRRGTLGDDLALYSNTDFIDPDLMTKLYNAFGLKANLSKTTSGPVGEFLRQTYSNRGIMGYPALGLKTIVFANPWLENYMLEFEEEIANGWLTYYSRMLPFRVCEGLDKWIFNTIIHDIMQQTKFKSFPWKDWLHTPVCAGGGGPSEWSKPSCWTTARRTRDNLSSRDIFWNAFGLLKKQNIRLHTITPARIDISNLHYLIQRMKSIENPNYIPPLPKNINLTSTLYEWYMGENYAIGDIERKLGIKIPISMRAAEKSVILMYLLGQEHAKSGITSIQTTKELTSQQTKITKFLTRSVTAANVFKRTSNLDAAATIVASEYLKHTVVSYGTW